MIRDRQRNGMRRRGSGREWGWGEREKGILYYTRIKKERRRRERTSERANELERERDRERERDFNTQGY